MNLSLKMATFCLASLLALIQLQVTASAQTPVAPTIPAPQYTPPDFHDVLTSKAPLRVLIISRQAMLAWKGDSEVRAITLLDGNALYTSPAGEVVGVARATDDHSASLRKNSQNFCPIPGAFRLESAKPIQLWLPGSKAFTSYPTPLIVTPTADGTFSVAREMLLEEYLRNVVPSEMPTSFHAQALRAQAIIARTYALTQLGRHADEGADLCATVHCQAYWPDAKRTRVGDEAVSATKGLVLQQGDKLIAPYYHACCGGATDDANDVWGPEFACSYLTGGTDNKANLDKLDIKDILTGRIDTYCSRSTNTHWTKEFSAAQVNALVSRNLGKVTDDPTVKITTVTNMTIDERTSFGRAETLRVEGNDASVLVYGDQIRWLFGSGVPGSDGLWSTLFDLTVTRDATGTITGYTFTGAGRGHGLGLCQWGADGRARAGQNFREILRAYYPGTRLSDEKR